MKKNQTLGEYLSAQGVTRRGFMKFCSATASLMALSPSVVGQVAQALASARRPSVVWLSFQECTGCTESLTRAHAPTVESLIFDAISLDYHHTLQVASGEAAPISAMLRVLHGRLSSPSCMNTKTVRCVSSAGRTNDMTSP